jgi:hypothetical protein
MPGQDQHQVTTTVRANGDIHVRLDDFQNPVMWIELLIQADGQVLQVKGRFDLPVYHRLRADVHMGTRLAEVLALDHQGQVIPGEAVEFHF